MQCPSCFSENTRVLESRTRENGKTVRRRRECIDCQHRFTTYERVEFVAIAVMKKDGSTESFDRSKVLRGIVRACEKMQISSDMLESLVDNIESEIEAKYPREITSQQIGQLVLSQLRKISEVAYIRFASVYENFTSIDDFVTTLKHLQHRRENIIYETQEISSDSA